MMKLKRLLLFLFLAVPIGLSANGDKEQKRDQDEGIHWVSIEEAQALTKENPRTIFVDVYTDWCGWCKVMDKRNFNDDEVIEYVNEHYYAVKLNAESRDQVTFNGTTLSEAELAHAFGVNSFPTIVLINETFDMVAPAPGYRKARDFQKMLEEFKEYSLENQKK